ncbi:MAG: thermonuclease family protein [Microcystaceae cyanobacterium]
MKRILNTIPLLIALALIAHTCSSRTSGISPSKNVSSSDHFPICQVKEGSVYDGDTLRVMCQGQESKIRFACIDAPEAQQEGGIRSRDSLRSLLNRTGNQVKVNAVDKDRYGRTVAELFVLLGDKWEQVQLQEVKDGMVWANGKYKSDCPNWNAIEAAEKEARSQRKGIWAGNPTPPWEFRHR